MKSAFSRFFNLKEKISEIDKGNEFGFILGLNPRVECSSLNVRLKKQHAQATTC